MQLLVCIHGYVCIGLCPCKYCVMFTSCLNLLVKLYNNSIGDILARIGTMINAADMECICLCSTSTVLSPINKSCK